MHQYCVGDKLRRETEFTDVQLREGSTGTLILATVTRRIYTPRGLALLTEDSHSVFREAVSPGTKSGIPKTEPAPTGMQWSRTITPDPVSLFRYSALTFNPHRIHYDRPYAMEQEGYPEHWWCMGRSRNNACSICCATTHGEKSQAFSLRARAPLFDVAPFTVAARTIRNMIRCELFAITPQGGIAIQARARLE